MICFRGIGLKIGAELGQHPTRRASPAGQLLVGKCIFALANLTLSKLRRSVEFIFEDELLTPDADIIRRDVDMNTTSLWPNDAPW